MDRFRTGFFPIRFPFPEFLNGISSVFCQINLSGISNTPFFVSGFAVIGDIAEFMGPAALDFGPGVNQFTGRFKAGRAIHGNEFEMFALKPPKIQVLKERLPRFFGFSFGVFKIDQFTFTEHRDAVSGKNPSIDVFATDPDLEADAVKDKVLIFIEKRALVIGENEGVQLFADSRDFRGRDLGIEERFK
jgi:hypothetical protein